MMWVMPIPAPVVYGIRNCDTVKKARQWLIAHAVDHTFHDFKLQGVPEQRLDHWLQSVGWERLLNRQGTTWRKLDETIRNGVVDVGSARRVMLANASVIKRPVVEWDGYDGNRVTVGFNTAGWQALARLP